MTDELRELVAQRGKKDKNEIEEKIEIPAKYKMNDIDYKVKYSLWP